jgi:hypothetical protein
MWQVSEDRIFSISQDEIKRHIGPAPQYVLERPAEEVTVAAKFYNRKSGSVESMYKPNTLQKRKHQINSLAFDAQATIMPSCHHVIMSSCHHVTVSSCHHVITSSCHHACHRVIVSSCHRVIVSSCHHLAGFRSTGIAVGKAGGLQMLADTNAVSTLPHLTRTNSHITHTRVSAGVACITEQRGRASGAVAKQQEDQGRHRGQVWVVARPGDRARRREGCWRCGAVPRYCRRRGQSGSAADGCSRDPWPCVLSGDCRLALGVDRRRILFSRLLV